MIKYAGKDDYPAFEAFVKNHPKGHFLQSLYWADFKSAYSPIAIMSLDENEDIRGTMLITIHKEPILNTCVLYSARGPISNDAEATRELISEAQKIAVEKGAYMLTLDPDITEDDALLSELYACGLKSGGVKDEMGLLQPLSVFRIDIENKTDDELMASFHSKTRYSIRAALKSGATFRLGNFSDLPAFQALLVQTAKRDGFTARPLEYFENMFKCLPEEYVKLILIEYEGKIIAGSVLIIYGDKAWHLYGASDENFRDKMPNFLMQWEMIRLCIKCGCKLYDMRGVAGEKDKTKPLEGLFRFKKRFGGELITFVGRLDTVYNPTKRTVLNGARAVKKIMRKITGR